VYPVEGGVFGLGEGLPTAFAAITALLLAMDHYVVLTAAAVGAAALVVTELLVAGSCGPSLLTSIISKGLAGTRLLFNSG
jgi:hypothetical protein